MRRIADTWAAQVPPPDRLVIQSGGLLPTGAAHWKTGQRRTAAAFRLSYRQAQRGYQNLTREPPITWDCKVSLFCRLCIRQTRRVNLKLQSRRSPSEGGKENWCWRSNYRARPVIRN